MAKKLCCVFSFIVYKNSIVVRKPVFIILSAFFLCSCLSVQTVPSSYAAKHSETDITASCKIERDTHRGLDILYTPAYTIAVSRFPYVTENAAYRLVASRTFNGKMAYQVDVNTRRDTDWAFYREAIDSHHNRLPLVVDDHRVDAVANTIESFHIDVTREYLDQHTTIGLDILISGQRNEFRMLVPESVVKGFLGAMDAQWPK